MTALLLATLIFVGGHFVLSHPLRARLIGLVGARMFPAVYSIVTGATFVWMLFACGAAPHIDIWGKAEWIRWPLIVGMLPACILLVCGLTAPNPFLVGREDLFAKREIGQGIFAVTRHPVNWGFGIWGIGHAIMNGDSANLTLAGGIAILALFGSWAQEKRKADELGETWRRFAAATSYMPFAAIVQGRANFSLPEIGYTRLAAGILLWGALLHAHPHFIGVNPFGR